MIYDIIGIIGGIYGTWYFARQLYTAAMRDYILTGVPERRHSRSENQKLFRNNVVAAIIILPMMPAGAVFAALDLIDRV